MSSKSQIDKRAVAGDSHRAWAESTVLPLFGIDGRVRALGGYEDVNLLVDRESSTQVVMKISRSTAARDRLEFQNALMSHVAPRLGEYRVPLPLRSLTGESVLTVDGPDGSPRLVRVLEYVEGRELGAVRPLSGKTLENLGRLFGRLDAALEDFEHIGMRVEHDWDLVRFPEVALKLLQFVDDAGVREKVERVLTSFDEDVRSSFGQLQWQVIHGDGNEKNLLVGREVTEDATVHGIIDFGDSTFSVRAAEVAIAATYGAMGTRYPLRAAASVIGGYHGVNALDEVEIRVLCGLVRARAATSVLMAARARAQGLASDYRMVSEADALELLAFLDGVDGVLAECFFRHACGLEPHSRGARIRQRIEREASRILPALPECKEPSTWPVLDLHAATSSIYGWSEADTRLAFRRLVAESAPKSSAGAAVGRYGEARLLYTSAQFQGQDGSTRSVHLGVDVFGRPGTAVHAPVTGTVHSIGENSGYLDYGPTLILRHSGVDDTFYTLYGHLSGASLDLLTSGMSVEAGTLIGWLGDEAENGGWPPHLHFQVIADVPKDAESFVGACEPDDLDIYRSMCPDPSSLLGLPVRIRSPRQLDAPSIMGLRTAHVGPSLSVAYRRPLHIVRGIGAYLYDSFGQGYLDLVNNVAHVGHSNPRVTEAVDRQIRRLNTNTRYLHETLVRYAERLAGLLPGELSVCYLTCSGSEANDLALRLAAAHTGGSDVVVLEGAYHGNLSSLIAISPYKFDGPGGSGAPSHVCKVPVPDSYRGRHRGRTDETGHRYAEEVLTGVRAIDGAGRRLSAFFCESIPGCAGQLLLPPGYLEEATRYVRDAGGVYVADEVQVGFGRVGETFWGFELQGVVPDIVTLGKPIGNGFPMGAVVTTPAIAASFANGMEYFNTFGGNPVACAAGLAVLDVIEEDGLQERARVLGHRLAEGLRDLQYHHGIIGDVRGSGLFLGVELVHDRESRQPAAGVAAYVTERMKDRHVLLSTDGPDANVLKIKPPMVLTEGDVDRVLSVLDDVLRHPFVQEGAAQAAP